LLIVGTTLGLASLVGGLGAIFGRGQVLGVWPAFVPMMHGFIVLAAVCLAFLALGRYHALRTSVFYWVGIGYIGFGVAEVFYILAWPELLSGGRALIARLPSTSAWIGQFAQSFLVLTLLAAILSTWPKVGLPRGIRWHTSVAAGIGLVSLACVWIVLNEQRLPVLVGGSGLFTLLILAWNVGLILLVIAEALLAVHLYRARGEPFFGYLAAGLVAFAFCIGTAIIGGKRYDLWFYLVRVIGVGALLVTLFGLLLEFPRLIRLERESQARLAAEREWFQTTLASIGDAVITTDSHGAVTFLNPVAEAITGWAGPEVVGQPLEKVFPMVDEPTQQPLDSPVAKVLQTGRVLGLANHTALLSRDGRVIPIEDSAAPIQNPSGETLGVVMVFHDVTKDRKVESELAYHAALLANMHDAVVATDATFRITAWNRGAETMYGWTAEEVLGKSSIDFFVTAFPEKDKNAMHMIVAEQGYYQGEAMQARKDGTRFTVDVNLLALRNESGETTGYLGVNRDVTDRKQKEQELIRLNRTLQALSRSSQTMVLLEDETPYLYEVCRIITQDCGHALAWVGFAEQDEARTVRPVAYAGFEAGYLDTLQITWADTGRGRGPTGTAIRSGQVSLCRDIRTDPQFAPWRAEALQRGYAACIVLPLLNAGTAFGVLSIYSRELDPFSDNEVALLTELANGLAYGIRSIRSRAAQERAHIIQLENEENRARIEVQRRLIEQREQERQRIARDLHDGPVQALLATGFALHGLRHGDCSEEVAQSLEAIQNSLQEQANELRAYAGELRPPILAMFGLAKAIRSHLESFQNKVPGVQFHFEEPSAGPMLPEAVRVTLYRIYQECLSNIVRHAQATEVTIRLLKTDQEARLEIQDNGVGFPVPRDWLDLVRQGHLGLVGMRERAEAVRGTLTVNSVPNQGTRIQVVIPIQREEGTPE